MAKRARKTYTETQRQEILAAAQKEGLTALQIQKKFGVTPVTYYSWRKKKGLKGPRGRRPAAAATGGDLSAQVRAGVQARVREILPGIVREEVAGYLDALFGRGGSAPRRRAPRKKK
jgi:transposase-like protein